MPHHPNWLVVRALVFTYTGTQPTLSRNSEKRIEFSLGGEVRVPRSKGNRDLVMRKLPYYTRGISRSEVDDDQNTPDELAKGASVLHFEFNDDVGPRDIRAFQLRVRRCLEALENQAAARLDATAQLVQ
jgi:hypothetical protein